MKRLARLLSFLSAGLGALTLFRSPRGILSLMLWYPKLLAGAWAPILALAGGLGALLSLVSRDWGAAMLGLVGAGLGMRHTAKVTVPHADFGEAFGPGWQARIPSALQARMQPRRYTLDLRASPKVSCQRDVVYGAHMETGDPLLADVWLPPVDVPRTGLGIIYIFGGAWHYMDRGLWVQHVLRYLAAQGHVVVNVGYTLAPRARLPAMMRDVKQAIIWLKANGWEYGLNAERIVLMGCSSGGHMALLAAYTPNHPAFQPSGIDADTSVRAVVSFSGITDLPSWHGYVLRNFNSYPGRGTPPEQWIADIAGWLFRQVGMLPPGSEIVHAREMLPSLLGGTPDQVPEQYRLGSPIEHVGPHCPPTLLIQGAHDYSGIRADVQRLHQALRAAGRPSIYVEFPETDHAFDVLTLGAARWAPAARAATYDTERFLALMV